MFSRTIVAVCFAIGANLAFAQTIQLISENEASLPASDQEPVARAITRGPGVRLVTPEAVNTGTFPFKVIFEPRGASKIDPSSVRLLYLKKPEVDLTDRVRGAIHPDGINVTSASAPRGDHPLRIMVRDDEGRQGSATLVLKIK